jgi:MinD superfamily P-loop ATPase
MKKILKFAVIAVFLATNVVFGQTVQRSVQRVDAQVKVPESSTTQYYDKNTASKMKAEFNKTVMVLAIEAGAPHYKKGTDVKEFIAASGFKTEEGIAFAKKLHEFLEKETAVKDIQASYDGKEIQALIDNCLGCSTIPSETDTPPTTRFWPIVVMVVRVAIYTIGYASYAY